VDVTHLRNRHRDHQDEHMSVPVSRCLRVRKVGCTRTPCHVWGERNSESRVVHASVGGVEPCFGLSGWAPATVTVMELSLLFH
jgi:hypothetical protein